MGVHEISIADSLSTRPYKYAKRKKAGRDYAIRISLNVSEIRDPWIFNASNLRSSERVAPVILASSDSLGSAKNVVEAVRSFRPAIRYGRESSDRLPELARRLGELLRREAGIRDCNVAMAPS